MEDKRMICYYDPVSKVDTDNQEDRQAKGEPDYPVERVNI